MRLGWDYISVTHEGEVCLLRVSCPKLGRRLHMKQTENTAEHAAQISARECWKNGSDLVSDKERHIREALERCF